MKKRNILKGAGVLLIAAIMILSTVAVTANTEVKIDEKLILDNSELIRSIDDDTTGTPYTYEGARDSLYLQSPVGSSGEWAFATSDVLLGYLCQDNFHDVADQITDIHWWGLTLIYSAGWINSNPDGMEFEIIFYEDDAGAPGAVVATYSNVLPTYSIYDVYGSAYDGYYFSVDVLDPGVSLAAGWVSIQSTYSPTGTSLLWSSSLDVPPGDGTALQSGQPPLLYDLAFELTGGGGQPEIPDLDCDGSLSWEDVEPSATVTGEFTVENIGDDGSLLDWEVESYPDWGSNWTFDPDGGTDLPKGAPVTVDVELVAPEDPETEFEGEIVLVNSDDPDDTCIIDVALATPTILLSCAHAMSYISLSKANNPAPLFFEDWIHYDDGTNVDGIGLTSGGSFEWGIRLTPTELTGYDGEFLTTVRFHHGPATIPQPAHSGNIYVYEAGTPTSPGAQIPSATTPWTHTGSDWVEITLTNPVTIDASQDLWITVDVTHLAGEYPAGCGPGPQVPGKGGWITLDGVTWDEIGLLGLDYNWNLWAGIAGGQPEVPDLDCDGTLSWTEVTPGETVTGTFTVENIGDPLSLLDWEIESYPDWGTWTFDPDGGTGLLPGAPVTVNVEIVAPDDPETNFTGEIVLVNSDNPDDTCIIDVSLATPVSQQSLIFQFFEMLAQRFPILGMILAALF